jgi:membrane fusion protein, multidrug efflux system
MSPNAGKKKSFVIALIAGLVVGGVFLAFHIISGLTRIGTDDAYVTGRIHNIAPKIPGTIKSVHVEDNQGIKKGDVLVEIDPVDYELRVNEAKAAVSIRETTFDQAERDEKRAEALYKDEVFSKERYENTSTAHSLAKAQLEAARVQLKIAEQNLVYTKIYAPADGYITSKVVEEGNQVQPGQPLLAVVALDDIWIIANYKETQLKKVMPGQKVLIKVDTYPDKVFTGKVDSIMAGTGAAFSLFPPENALGNYVKVVQRIPVKIVFDKTTEVSQALRIGMSCVPTIITTDR